jgi:hypothetical protein
MIWEEAQLLPKWALKLPGWSGVREVLQGKRLYVGWRHFFPSAVKKA